ncbi:13638_t:CDS:2 [Funneliformis geosporum]|nr:13638_t:CDS:2 [Funneliformis geosporum]
MAVEDAPLSAHDLLQKDCEKWQFEDDTLGILFRNVHDSAAKSMFYYVACRVRRYSVVEQLHDFLCRGFKKNPENAVFNNMLQIDPENHWALSIISVLMVEKSLVLLLPPNYWLALWRNPLRYYSNRK